MFSILRLQRKEPDLAVDFGTAILRAGLADGRRVSEVPSREGMRPALRQGVVADSDTAAAVLDRVFARYSKRSRRDLSVLACAPSDATEADQARLSRALQMAGAARTALVPEPVAALIGAGVDIGTDGAFLVIDLGEGVFDCALVKERRLFDSATWRGGCAALRQTVEGCLRETFGLQVSEAEAEAVLRRIGVEANGGTALPVRGRIEDRDIAVSVPVDLLHAALQPKTERIAETLLTFLTRLEPKLCAEVIANGVEITGGGVLIPGLVDYCARVTHLPLRRAPQPLQSVIHGACSLLGTTARLNLWDSLHTFWPSGNARF